MATPIGNDINFMYKNLGYSCVSLMFLTYDSCYKWSDYFVPIVNELQLFFEQGELNSSYKSLQTT